MSEQDNLTTKLMDDMPEDLLDFVKTRVNSFIKWDLIRFFNQNPNTMDTAENIAKYAGRPPNLVAPELEDLAGSGVMDRRQVGDHQIYTLSTDPAVRDLASRFMIACEDRKFRVQAIYHVIKNMQNVQS